MPTTERQVRLFRNGRNQAIRIPREFELEGNEAIIRKEGDRLVLESIHSKQIGKLLDSWEPIIENLDEIKDHPVKPEEIF